jgi:hypothetical protein
MNSTQEMQKSMVPLKTNHDYNLETQRTPSSLLLLITENENSVHVSLSNLGNENEVRRSGKESYTFKVLFVGLSKIINDYYAPIA